MTWTRESVRSELHTLLAQHADDGAAITDKSGLVADLGLDSLGVMEIIAEIEDKFELNIPDEVLREVETVGDVVAQIEKHLSAEGRLAG